MMRRSSLPLLGALSFLWLVSSCGDSSGPQTPAGEGFAVEFLEVTVAPGGDLIGKAELVRHFGALESETWKVDGCTKRLSNGPLSRGGKKVDALVIEKQDRVSLLRIPGPFDPASFNFLSLRAKWNQKWEAAIELRTKGKSVARTIGQVVPPESGVGKLFFALPETRRLKAPIDEIVLRMTDARKPLALVDLTLLHNSDFMFLPTPGADAGPGLVTIGEESRNALGVTSVRPLQAEASSSEGAQLRFSYGIPANLRRDVASPDLRLSIKKDGAPVGDLSFELGSGAGGWKQQVLPLDSYGAGDLTFEWSLEESAGGLESVCALGEVTLLRPGAPSRVVVFITSDTHRGDHMGLADEGVDIETPRMDEIAQRGVFFEDCFSTTNITNPSHIALMTGVHPRDTGIHNNYTRVSGAAPTLAEAFRDAGYVTYAALSTKHLADASSGLGQGFERVVAPTFDFARDGAVTLDLLEEWVDESAGLPVFVWLHLFDAHMPYGKDTPGVARYYPGKRKAFDKNLPELEPHVQKAIKNLQLKDLRDLDYPRAMYKAEITDLDERMGRLLDKPFFANAVLGITADHGENLGEHDLYFAHEELYRGSLHVPLILTWPGAPAGERYAAPVSNLDLGRTLLDLSGNFDVDFPGRNLAQLLDSTGEEGAPRFSLSAHGREAALTEGGWHFQLRLKPNDKRAGEISRPRHKAELYYLPDDPRSDHDLIEKEFDRAKAMRDRLIEWLEGAEDRNWKGGDSGNSANQAQLTALGYAQGEEEDSSGGKAVNLAPSRDCDCEWCERWN